MRIRYGWSTLNIFRYLASLGAYSPPQNFEQNGTYSEPQDTILLFGYPRVRKAVVVPADSRRMR